MDAHGMRVYDAAALAVLARHGYDESTALADFDRFVADHQLMATTNRYAQVVVRLWRGKRLVGEGWGATPDEARLAAFAQLLDPYTRGS